MVLDEEGGPVVSPAEDLRFSNFASLFPPDNKSFEASMWRLGAALFDPPVDRLGEEVHGEIKAAVRGLTFKSAISEWLESTVSPAVTEDLAKETAATDARRVFLMLTGHQVTRATEAAMEANDINLAMLVSQAGGDRRFKELLATQLESWQKDGAEALIDPSYTKVMALLAGLIALRTGSAAGLTANLDWKRVLGLYLWYTSSLEEPVGDAILRFQEAVEEGQVVVQPWYTEDPTKAKDLVWKPRLPATPTDGLLGLMQLCMDQSYNLTKVLSPTGFSPSPLDYRLPWHLSMLMTQVMSITNFKDRDEHDRGGNEGTTLDEGSVGISHTSQVITLNYAMQLEYLGLKEQALFVLLHLEEPAG